MVESGDVHRADDVTRRLNADAGSDAPVGRDLPAYIYRQLKSLAHRQLQREFGERTLSTTALVHEAWLQVGDSGGWESREHFFRYAATTMRHILVDQARRKLADKRGSGARRVTLATRDMPVADAAAEMLDLDNALGRLALENARLAEVVELRFFAGLSVVETARVLGVSERSVVRDWRVARAMIHRSMEQDHVT